MQEKILAKLQELRAEDDLAAMEFAAGRSEEMMKAYCNMDELPEELLGAGGAGGDAAGQRRSCDVLPEGKKHQGGIAGIEKLHDLRGVNASQSPP